MSITLIFGLFDISEDTGGKVLQTSEESLGSLFVEGGGASCKALQEHTLQLILHDLQISVPK